MVGVPAKITTEYFRHTGHKQYRLTQLATHVFIYLFVCLWRDSPQWARASSFTRFLDHTRRITVSRTPLDEWSAHRRDLYLTTHNTQNKHPCPGGVRTHNLSRRAAADLRLRPRGHWDRRSPCVVTFISTLCIKFNKKYVQWFTSCDMYTDGHYVVNPYPTAFPYGNGMVLHFYQQQDSSTTKTVHKVINKGLKAYV